MRNYVAPRFACAITLAPTLLLLLLVFVQIKVESDDESELASDQEPTSDLEDVSAANPTSGLEVVSDAEPASDPKGGGGVGRAGHAVLRGG